MSDVLSWIRLPGPFLIGHRGFPAVARENTPASFEAALEAGCDGVELDVRMTSDGVAVVHHDETAIGEAGPVRLERMSWKEVASARFRGTGESANAYRVSGLDEVLAGLCGRGLINVEIKPPGPGREARAAETLVATLDRVRPRESVLVSSFDPGVLGKVRGIDSSVPLGFLFSSPRELNHLEEDPLIDALAALHPRHDLLDRKLMKRAQERGLMVNTWTVDDPRDVRRVIDLGVTSVITNRPDLCGAGFYD